MTRSCLALAAVANLLSSSREAHFGLNSIHGNFLSYFLLLHNLVRAWRRGVILDKDATRDSVRLHLEAPAVVQGPAFWRTVV